MTNMFEINKNEGIGLEDVIINIDAVVAKHKPAIITIEDGNSTDPSYKFRRHMNGEYVHLCCRCTLELTLQSLFAIRQSKGQRLVTFAAWQEKEEVIFEFIWRVNRR